MPVPDTLPDGSPWPRVSVITPSYNQAGFIEEAIRSVLLQGYPNLEFIIIDGGSTDGSVEIIRKYAPWLAYWVSEPDRGQSHAINKGWAKATGDWLGWLNSDDSYRKNALQRLAQAWVGDATASLFYGDVDYVTDNGDVRSVFRPGPFSLRAHVRSGMIHTPSVFWHRALNQLAGELNEHQHYAMDNDFWLRVAPNARCRYIPFAFGTFRRHESSKTVGGEAKLWQEMLEILTTRLAEAPYDSLLLPSERDEILEHTRWQTAVLLARSGQYDAARDLFLQCLANGYPHRYPDQATLAIVREALENRPASSDDVVRVLEQLPMMESQKRRFNSRTWRAYHRLRFYTGFSAADSPEVLRSGFALIRHDPAFLLQRGSLSMLRSALLRVFHGRTFAW